MQISSPPFFDERAIAQVDAFFKADAELHPILILFIPGGSAMIAEGFTVEGRRIIGVDGDGATTAVDRTVVYGYAMASQRDRPRFPVPTTPTAEEAFQALLEVASETSDPIVAQAFRTFADASSAPVDPEPVA